jgi:hypothetical protein
MSGEGEAVPLSVVPAALQSASRVEQPRRMGRRPRREQVMPFSYNVLAWTKLATFLEGRCAPLARGARVPPTALALRSPRRSECDHPQGKVMWRGGDC